MSASTLSFYTFLVAICILAPFWIVARRPSTALRERSSRDWGHAFASYLLLGVVGLLPTSILMSWGIEHSSGSNAAILTLTIPILMVAVAVPMLGERFTWIRVFTLLISLTGAVLISRDDVSGGSFTSSTLAGNAVISAACAGAAFYNIYSKKLLQQHSELEVLIYGYAVAVALCALTSLSLDAQPFYQVKAFPASAWIAVLALGSLTWGISNVLFMWLLQRIDIGQISVSIYLLSFFGVVFSAATLGERVGIVQMVGAIVVITATVLSDSHERNARRSVT